MMSSDNLEQNKEYALKGYVETYHIPFSSFLHQLGK